MVKSCFYFIFITLIIGSILSLSLKIILPSIINPVPNFIRIIGFVLIWIISFVLGVYFALNKNK